MALPPQRDRTLNMDNEFQSRVEQFSALKSKYQATKYENSFPSSLLYLILRKLDLEDV